MPQYNMMITETTPADKKPEPIKDQFIKLDAGEKDLAETEFRQKFGEFVGKYIAEGHTGPTSLLGDMWYGEIEDEMTSSISQVEVDLEL
ncbi:hypothetical protein [Streptomyces sp. CoH17]|uniref:hypothetical protein n=1 Tax=Streptomyces sp. CoH17 TaxID=2992806 RepID=UPI002271D8C1|nr:hypothetical protein [Streptomyces sp. CoH17]